CDPPTGTRKEDQTRATRRAVQVNGWWRPRLDVDCDWRCWPVNVNDCGKGGCGCRGPSDQRKNHGTRVALSHEGGRATPCCTTPDPRMRRARGSDQIISRLLRFHKRFCKLRMWQ